MTNSKKRIRTKPKKVRNWIGSKEISVIVFGAAVVALHVILSKAYSLPSNSVIAANKPYATFNEFYPFYLSQHEDVICRRLHFIGTSLIFLWALVEPGIFVSFGLATLLGSSAFPATRAYDNGLFELLLVFPTFLFSMNLCTKSWVKPLMVLFLGYGFAWVGHFMFEHNRPASFIYPTYSLLGDFKLWFEIASFARKF